MNFSQLKYFMAVVENQNFTATAKTLYISQQALSAHIAQLEKELNTVLLERTHPLRLTEAGQRLYAKSQQILFLEHQLHSELADISDSQQRTLTLGISSAYARALLPHLLGSFFALCPQAKLELKEATYPELGALLTNHEVDMVLSWPIFVEETVSVPVVTEHIYLVVPKTILQQTFGDEADHTADLLAKGEGLSILRQLPFILPRSGSIRASCNSLFLQEQITPRIVVETDWLETSIRLCQTGLGCTFAAGNMLTIITDSGSDLQVFPMRNAIAPRDISLYYLRSTYLSNAMQSFIQVCKDFSLPLI